MSEKIYNMVELETIEKLADLVSKKDLGEITIADGEKTITIKGKKCSPVMSASMAVPGAVTTGTAATEKTEAAKETAASETAGNVIKAPLVGTFYAAPSPDQPPFVQVGDSVKKGDVIMIIESMKLMNEVQSDTDGVVKEILVQNGDPVEYDQPLMVIG